MEGINWIIIYERESEKEKKKKDFLSFTRSTFIFWGKLRHYDSRLVVIIFEAFRSRHFESFIHFKYEDDDSFIFGFQFM